MDYNERWEKIEKLGEGGQGEVYKVLDKSKFNLDEMLSVIRTGVSRTQYEEKQREEFGAFRQTILDFSRMEDPVNQGALKFSVCWERDLIRQIGEERLLSMAIDERFEREEPLEKRYADEFYNHGLDNLTFRS
ncbi:hypothetical protein MYX78_09245 [Acidobacteria bacterium AH-259-G07]|nr:hypothetical protein [Acidobacteria bacterium AH-259-G07]